MSSYSLIDQNAEDLSEVTADETSSIPVLEGFEPIENRKMSHYSLLSKMQRTSRGYC